MKRREFIALLTAGGTTAAIVKGQQTLPNAADWLHTGPMLGHSEIGIQPRYV